MNGDGVAADDSRAMALFTRASDERPLQGVSLVADKVYQKGK
jgi:hypothetical protein